MHLFSSCRCHDCSVLLCSVLQFIGSSIDGLVTGFLWISRLVIDCVVVVVCCVLCAVPFGRQLPFWRVGRSALRLAPSRPRRHSLLSLSHCCDCVPRSSDNSYLLFAPLLSSIHQHAVVQCALCCHRTPALLVHFSFPSVSSPSSVRRCMPPCSSLLQSSRLLSGLASMPS